MESPALDEQQLAVFVQVNDFYHIDYSADPSDPSTRLLPRVVTIMRRLRREFGSHRVVFSLPGDFLNPACLSRTHRSRQMIDVLNQLAAEPGASYPGAVAIFGNHEFDWDKDHFTVEDLLDRVRESRFQWLASNLVPSTEIGGADFFDKYPVKDHISVELGPDHKIYIFGISYPCEYTGFGEFTPPAKRCRELIQRVQAAQKQMEGSIQASRYTFVALTHQELEDDKTFANEVPGLFMVMGGHDHEVLDHVNSWNNNCTIVKAKSNARTICLNSVAYVPQALIDRVTATFGSFDKAFNERIAPTMGSLLVRNALAWDDAPEKLKSDPDVKHFFESWPTQNTIPYHSYPGHGAVLIANVTLDTMHPGFQKLVEPDRECNKLIDDWLGKSPEHCTPLLKAPVALESNDDACRSRSTNLGNLMADLVRGQLRKHKPERVLADIAFVNSGSFRLNRDIAAGEVITKAVTCDLLFHPNAICLYRMPGSAVAEIVKLSMDKRRAGHFLQLSGLVVKSNPGGELEIVFVGEMETVVVGNSEIVFGNGPTLLDATRDYSVATTSYLARSPYGDILKRFGQPQIIEDSIREAFERELLLMRSVDFSGLNSKRWQFQGEE